MSYRKTTPCRLGALLVCALAFFAACQEPARSGGQSQGQTPSVPYAGGWAREELVTNWYNTGSPQQIVSVWVLTDMSVSSFSSSGLASVYDPSRDYDIQIHYAITHLDPEDAYGMYTQEEEDEQVRRLITELLAGEGPDVLILDGCNARDFAARGALMDLAGVAREMGVYENLTQGLVINGQLPYVPYLARAPLLWGPPEEVQGVESFAQLAERMLAGPKPQWPGPLNGASSKDPLLLKLPPLPEDQRSVVNFDIGGGYIGSEFINLINALYLPRLVQDGGLDTATLQAYYSYMKRIHDANDAILQPVTDTAIQLSNNRTHFMGLSGASLHLGYARLAAASTGSAVGSFILIPAFTALAQNRPLAVRPFPATEGAVWQPHTLMAVNKNSKNPQLAMRFIRDMLSDEYQAGPLANEDLPVTQSAVETFTRRRFPLLLQSFYGDELAGNNLANIYGEDHAGIQWIKNPTDDFPFNLDALMRALDTAYLPEPVIENAVYEYYLAFAKDELTLDEAVAACEADLQVYLNERQ